MDTVNSSGLTFREANSDDVAELVALSTSVSERLTMVYGQGHWTSTATEAGVQFKMRRATVYVGIMDDKLMAAFALSTRKPWAIDVKYFSRSRRPLYLTAMEVAPSEQGKGLGRCCIEEALKTAREWPADCIRLDAYDADAGAGGFYLKCGFEEVGRVTYRDTPLVYYERML